jgi:hypothetical protein
MQFRRCRVGASPKTRQFVSVANPLPQTEAQPRAEDRVTRNTSRRLPSSASRQSRRLPVKRSRNRNRLMKSRYSVSAPAIAYEPASPAGVASAIAFRRCAS